MADDINLDDSPPPSIIIMTGPHVEPPTNSIGGDDFEDPTLEPSKSATTDDIDVENNSEGDQQSSQLKQPRWSGKLCGRGRCCFPLVARVRKTETR